MLVLSVKQNDKITMGDDTTVEVFSVFDDYVYVSINKQPPIKISYQPVEITPNNFILFKRRRTRSNVARIGLSSPNKIILKKPRKTCGKAR